MKRNAPALMSRWILAAGGAGAGLLLGCREPPPADTQGSARSGDARPAPSAEIDPDVWAETKPKARPPIPLVDGEDISNMVRAWNAETIQPPPSRFASLPGQITATPLAVRVPDASVRGFRVRTGSGTPVPTPALHRGTLLVPGGLFSTTLVALEAKTGKLQWELALSDAGASSPSCEGDMCTVMTESCTLYGVDISTGGVLWSHYLGAHLSASPSVAGGLVFASYPPPVPSADEQPPSEATPESMPRGKPLVSYALGAFDLRTGQLRWSRWIDSDVIGAPVVDNGFVYAATYRGVVHVLDAETGALIGARQARATSTPVIAGGELFYTKRTDQRHVDGDADFREAIARTRGEGPTPFVSMAERPAPYLSSMFRVLSGEANGAGPLGGAELIDAPDAQGLGGSRVLPIGDTLFATMGEELVAVRSTDGAVLFRVALGRSGAKTPPSTDPLVSLRPASPPIVAGDSVLVATTAGQVLRVDPRTGEVRARYEIGAPAGGQPLAMDGWIYATTQDGQVVGIDTGDPTLTGWSQWGGDARRSGVAAR